MAGGIFVDQPFHPNPKCLLFSAVIMALYWFSPARKNAYLLPVIFILSYVAMAWYDYMYNCDLIMYSGNYSGMFTSPFKPQLRREAGGGGGGGSSGGDGENGGGKKKLSKNQEQEYLHRVYLFHVLAVVPVLLYVGYYGKKVNAKIFPVVMAMGLMALLYHGFRLFYPRDTYCATN